MIFFTLVRVTETGIRNESSAPSLGNTGWKLSQSFLLKFNEIEDFPS